MLWILWMACASPTSNGQDVPQTTENRAPEKATAPTEVGIKVLKSELSSGVAVLDVRTPREFAAGHVPGAINIELSKVTAKDEQIKALIAKEGPLYVICQSGGRSARATSILRKSGVDAVNVLGGTAAWIRDGNKVEK